MKRANGLNILGRHFKPRAVPTVMSLFFIILFIALGFWQIRRYHYKLELLQQYTTSMHQPPISLTDALRKHAVSFKQVKVIGKYVNNLTSYIQNRYDHNHVGYNVLTPIRMPGDKRLLLINRGWVPFTRKLSPPKITAVNGTQTVAGYIKLLNEYIFTLGKNIVAPTLRPLVMQKVNVQQLQKLTGQHYYPFVLRLNATQKHGFVRNWQPINVLPARHMGYAVQWFVMALVLAIAYFIFSSAPVTEEKKNVKKSK